MKPRNRREAAPISDLLKNQHMVMSYHNEQKNLVSPIA